MRFVLKAIFFLAVVAAFIPRQPDAEAGTTAQAAAPVEAVAAETAAPEPVGVQIDLQPEALAAGPLCAQQPGLCDVARESAAAARLIGGVAASQARRAFDEAMAQPPAAAPTPAQPAPGSPS